MPKKIMLAGAALSFVVGCASHPKPADQIASSIASIRGAQEAGAARVPEASLHLKLAEEQVEQAKTLMDHGEDERAHRMAMRAYTDAELALALARSQEAQRKLASLGGGQQPSNAPIDPAATDMREVPTAGGSQAMPSQSN